MAKRKRLTPASPAFLDAAPQATSPVTPALRAAPIADIARDAATNAAAADLSRAMSEARAEGRMVIAVPLNDVVLDYLVRDRVVTDDDEMDALKESLRARGQQTPIETVALDDGRYGLISGWRRCAALQALYTETKEARFASVLCLLRQPAEHADSYVAMVEENEIRVGLSYFERARIVVKAVEQGVFDSDRAALQTLFRSASRAKRSKIGSFLGVVRALDGTLRFPAALAERQGLQLARALAEEEGLADMLRDALHAEAPTSPEAETAMLAKIVSAPRCPKTPAPSPAKKGTPVVGGIQMQYQAGRLVLEGRAVNDALQARLVTWLRQNI